MKQSLYIPILIFLLTGCSDNKTSQSKDIRKVLSGEFAKLWVFKTSDSFDCHCYYTLIYKSGKMNYMVRDKFTGTFTNYFNELSGDNINNDKTWRYENDTLRLIGFPYQIRRISANLDTIVLTSNSEINNLSTYYLIDSRLIDFDRTSD